MLKIISSTISPKTQTHLNSQQADIDGQASYEQQVKRAAILWDGKEASIAKKAAFLEIKAKLIENTVGKHYCSYCEHNEHSDIEHIYPKGLYPNKAFVWENYMWACKKCNSGLKLDKFKIFNPIDSSNIQDITPPHHPRAYTQPPNEAAVLINPREDDPLDYLFLNLTLGVTELHPDISTIRDRSRAEYTLELLKLNKREALKEARINACKSFIHSLKRYIIAKNATSFEELEECMEELLPVDFTHSLEHEKTITCLNIQKDILARNHPTVWKEMQRQHLLIDKLTKLFSQAPEALEW